MYVNPGVLDRFRRSVLAMRLLLLEIAAFFLVPNLYADEQLLVMTVYARIVLAGQVAPAPDPFLEAAVRDEIPAIGEGIQALQGKSFQISSKSRISHQWLPGWKGRRSRCNLPLQFSRMEFVR